uniref:ATP synthase F0 subunit 6 n=1 Tax=Peronia verruculata TaxID=500109 RepID=UPI00226C8E52|nr:ATP synthase F0 subunit 6 [Peronia verruculata]UZH97760.1 ATP synthase F0 subunit 6 [Peronia verruculata]
MTTDLFSSLDGCQSIWSWLIPMVVFFMFILNSSNGSNSTGSLLLSTFTENKKNSLLPMSLFLYSLMLFLVMLNLIGLVPYAYGVTSALWAAGSLALTMWGLLIISGWTYNPKESAAHLAPAGAPAGLVSFLVLVETISILIRPLTLTVRLIANISAGHIVLSLVANCLTGLSLFTGLSVLLISIGYNLFEVFVCFIQAYIFTLLVSLYAQEHPY